MSGASEGSLILDPNRYLADCFRLARAIWDDGLRPDFLIALWRGGAPPGIVIQEYFRWRGHDPYHTAIRTQSLEGVRHGGGYDIKGIEHVIDVVEADQQMLIVDDFFDTGRTAFEVTDYMRQRARRNMPEVRVAAVYVRPSRQRHLPGPRYFLHRVEEHPVFPHRLLTLPEEVLRRHDVELCDLVHGSAP